MGGRRTRRQVQGKPIPFKAASEGGPPRICQLAVFARRPLSEITPILVPHDGKFDQRVLHNIQRSGMVDRGPRINAFTGSRPYY